MVEGEKAVNRLIPLGFVATCPPTGTVWDESYTDALWRAGAMTVVVVADGDRPGHEHAHRVVRACHGYRPALLTPSTAEEPWATWPCAEPDDDEVQPLRTKLLTLDDLPYRQDICDWLDAGHTAEELRALIDAAPDLDAVNQAKEERKRKLARERQRKHRAKILATTE